MVGMRLAVVAVVTLVVADARAQTAADRTKAAEHFQQAEAYFQVAAYDAAIREYEAAYALVPKPGFLFNVGLCHEALGDRAKALDHYRRYLAAAPDGQAAAEARARVLGLERAIADAERAAAEDERRQQEAAERERAVREHIGRAEVAAAQGRHDDAIAAYRAAYEISRDAELLVRIAAVYEQAGRADDAIVQYEAYLVAAPAGPSAEPARARMHALRAAASAAPPTVAAATEPRKPRRFALGVKLGVNVNKPGFFVADNEQDSCFTPVFIASPAIGVAGAYAVNSWFGVQGELLYILRAIDVECSGDTIPMPFAVDVHTFELPVLARVAYAGRIGGAALYAGGVVVLPVGYDNQQSDVDVEDPGLALGLAVGGELSVRLGPGDVVLDVRFEGNDQKYFAMGPTLSLEVETEATFVLLAGYMWR
jgi:tetratricopeptide (TPR) repeat protein